MTAQKKTARVTVRHLPLGSVISGRVTDHGYVIEKIEGFPVAYAGASVYRAGDRITEETAIKIGEEKNQSVTSLKGGAE